MLCNRVFYRNLQYFVLSILGDKLTDEECDVLFKDVEDKKGRINIEGK